MNKSDLIASLSEAKDLSIHRADQIVNLVFSSMSDELLKSGRIEIRGFGSFAVKDYDGYIGRNPRTGIEVNVAPKKLPIFRAGKEIKARLLKNT